MWRKWRAICRGYPLQTNSLRNCNCYIINSTGDHRESILGNTLAESSRMVSSGVKKQGKIEWTKAQIDALEKAEPLYRDHKTKWIKVAKFVPGRTAKECR